MHLSSALLPSQLLLPATLMCPFPAVLKLSYGALPSQKTFELLFVPETHLTELVALAGTVSRLEFTNVVTALRAGQVPDAEVPVFAGTEDAVQALSRIDVLSALQHLGHRWLPALTTAAAANWFKTNASATRELPLGWDVRAT